MHINSNELKREFLRHQSEYEQKTLEVLRSGWYVLGNEVARFEEEFAGYLHARHCVGVASGLDALILAFKVLKVGEGDEVIVPANTYIASIMGITANGAVPVFVEPDEYNNVDVESIESKVTSRTKAVLSVNLYGQACQMVRLQEICRKYGLYLVEDCAQSHGAEFLGKKTNEYSDISCFSFYPSKNLGGFGDGGAIVTDNDTYDYLMRVYRNYGSDKRYHNIVEGMNSRLDELQAGLLRVKLRHIDELTRERRRLAARYLTEIVNPRIELPKIRESATSVWHLFVAKCNERDQLISYMEERDISILIHYPIPPHLSKAYEYLGYRLGAFPITEREAKRLFTLPMYYGMTKEEQSYVINALNDWKG